MARLDQVPRHFSCFPISWLTAATLAAQPAKRDGTAPWISVDWARGESGAVSRMKRLREFHRGLQLYKTELAAELAEMLDSGWQLAFQKRMVAGVWDVQLRWVNFEERAAGLEILKEFQK